jgi:hypothetical protein
MPVCTQFRQSYDPNMARQREISTHHTNQNGSSFMGQMSSNVNEFSCNNSQELSFCMNNNSICNQSRATQNALSQTLLKAQSH